MPPKKIEYADFLTQFELLYRNTIMFEMKSKNLRCSKTQITRSLLYKILFFEIVVLTKLKKKLSEAEPISLKKLIKSIDLVIQKADKDNTVVITLMKANGQITLLT